MGNEGQYIEEDFLVRQLKGLNRTTCSRCTYVNSAHATTCEMCGCRLWKSSSVAVDLFNAKPRSNSNDDQGVVDLSSDEVVDLSSDSGNEFDGDDSDDDDSCKTSVSPCLKKRATSTPATPCATTCPTLPVVTPATTPASRTRSRAAAATNTTPQRPTKRRRRVTSQDCSRCSYHNIRYQTRCQMCFAPLNSDDVVSTDEERGLEVVNPDRFQIFAVKKTISIKEFELSLGLEFKTGRGFYEFTKPEKISLKKEIILQDKKSDKFFTGKKAQEMLGVDETTAVSRMYPASFQDYRVFVQSTSYNRKLVAGTKFLYAG